MAQIIARYPMPFIDRVTMPMSFARFIASPGTGLNTKLYFEPAVDGCVTWDYTRHGTIPWMQFFYDWRFGDLDGDGGIDFILTCGAFRQIAYHRDGHILWSFEDPTAGFMDMRLDANYPIVDIDGDGKAELICARKRDGRLHLCVVNGLSGAVKHSIPYPGTDLIPHDLRGSITIGDVTGRGAARDIIVSWDYKSVYVLGPDLELKWHWRENHPYGRKHCALGHTPFAFDVDDSGRESIMAGSCLFGPDGDLRWVAEDLRPLQHYNHADSVRMARLHPEEKPRILMSTGCFCFSIDGYPIWGGPPDMSEGQALRLGKFLPDSRSEGLQIAIYEAMSRHMPGRPDRVAVFNRHGEMLWRKPFFQPEIQEGGFGFWVGDWDGDGLDEILVNDREKVNVLNGDGELIDTFPGHLIYLFDLYGDSRPEAICLSGIEPGFELQVVTNDKPNSNPLTSAILQRRVTTREMSNCTRY